VNNTGTQRARTRRVVGSMLWAGWADALGFISELTDAAGLQRRLAGQPLDAPVAWTRRVGGRFGVDVQLPAGCYSDDTQLRLATARAISSRGFDVDAFARIELPVWPAYALGGGRATKAAAANLAKSGTPWFGNFFTGWTDAGGNGVAMRIQPHVWAASHPGDLGPHIVDLLLNAVTTHGHPRGIVGAVLHALALGSALDGGQVPGPGRWHALLDMTEQAVKLMDRHPELSSLWRPSWEKTTGHRLDEVWRNTVDECRKMLLDAQGTIDALLKADTLGRASTYTALVDSLGLADPKTKGSGTATAIAALILAAIYPEDPSGAALLSARAIGTDTDTIATMAGAIIGAVADVPPPTPLLDAEHLTNEAVRLAAIAAGQSTAAFSYPDPLHWVPPQAQLDAVGTVEGEMALAGLGWLEPAPDREPVTARGSAWQWMLSDFGPTFLLKRRVEIRPLPPAAQPFRRKSGSPTRQVGSTDSRAQTPLYDDGDVHTERATRRGQAGAVELPAGDRRRPSGDRPTEADVDQMLTWVAKQGYTDEAIGYAVRRIVGLGTLEQLVAFTTALWARAKVRTRFNDVS
jgi:ADP-ribosylglycohydrolase